MERVEGKMLNQYACLTKGICWSQNYKHTAIKRQLFRDLAEKQALSREIGTRSDKT